MLKIIKYSEQYANPSIAIWNDIVQDGIAFPQTELLTEKTASDFFNSQSFTGLALDSDSDEVVGLYILHPNNVGRCGHISNASYAVKKDRRGQHIGEFLVKDCLKKAKELGVTPMATWIAGELAGCDPRIMGIGPVPATKKTMAKAGYQISDFDLIEANEAFAAQSVAVQKELGFSSDVLNVNGGAIALGHPVGCSGTRILVTLLYEMQKRDAHKGLATLCVGGGMGAAAIVER